MSVRQWLFKWSCWLMNPSCFTINRSAVMDEPSLWPLLSSGRPCCPDPAGKCSITGTSWTRCTPQGTSTGEFMWAAAVTWCIAIVGRDSTSLLCWRREEPCAWASILVWMCQEGSFCVLCAVVLATQFFPSCLRCLTDGERGKKRIFTLERFAMIVLKPMDQSQQI